jgi:hypothetical protein
MARTSHVMFHSKRRLGPAMRIVRDGIANIFAHTDAAPDSVSDKISDGAQHGVQNGRHGGQHHGQQNGAAHGEPDGALNGLHHGDRDGSADGASNGVRNGSQCGARNGAPHGRTLEQQLGVKFHVVDGVVVACKPGQPPPLEPIDHAEALLTWLQAQDQFVGLDVPSKTLEKMLYPHLAKQKRWKPFAWRLVAAELGALPAVEKRQWDRRSGADRQGAAPTVYYVPFPEEARAERALRERLMADGIVPTEG